MDSKHVECHEILTSIYDRADALLDELKRLSYDVTLNSYNKHFIKINGEYVEQKYYMPVISIKDKGDICFNLDGEQFEFYVTKTSLLNNINLQELINFFKDDLCIYEFIDCTKDVYGVHDDVSSLLDKVKMSRDDKFGVSLNSTNLTIDELMDKFNKMCSLLEL